MSTEIWPPIAPDDLAKEQAASLARELQWLLTSLQTTLSSLKAGLSEVAALLAPSEPGHTLVLSSHRSESVKGVISRIGTRIPKGSVALRLASLPPPRGAHHSASYPLKISERPQAPTLVLPQLVSVRTLVNTCLDIVDVSTWGGDVENADFLAGQLRLLEENVREAKAGLKGDASGSVRHGGDDVTNWWEQPVDESIFDPPLPRHVSFHLCIADAAIVLTLRTLSPSSQPDSMPDSGFMHRFNLGDKLAVALGAVKPPMHDEADQTFMYRGEEVIVKEKVRVETQDPSLMAALAKLASLERVVKMSRQALAIVMGRDMSDEEI